MIVAVPLGVVDLRWNAMTLALSPLRRLHTIDLDDQETARPQNGRLTGPRDNAG